MQLSNTVLIHGRVEVKEKPDLSSEYLVQAGLAFFLKIFRIHTF